MNDFDLDALIEASAVTAQIAGGASIQWVVNNSHDTQTALLLARQVQPDVVRNQPWSKEDYAFVERHIGFLSDEEMGRQLGRTEAAVKTKRVRKGMGSVSSRADYWSAREVAVALGIKCSKKVTGFIQDGLIKGYEAPLGRLFYQVYIGDVKRFACNPENWVCFDPKRVKHPEIRRLVLRQMRRWNDEWWTASQIAQYHGTKRNVVNHVIGKGRIPGKLYGKWYVRKSVATAPGVAFPTGKGVTNKLISERVDDFDGFVVVAVSVGISYLTVERLTQGEPRSIGHRYLTLRRLGKLQEAAAQQGYTIQVNQAGDSWIHHRQVKGRFPFLDRDVDRFVSGKPCSVKTLRTVAGVMEAWARHHARTDAQRATAQRMATYSLVGYERVWGLWAELKAWGYGDPLL